ncbi:STAS domain-containing protein [Streptomyces sp. NPDC004667]|uniref:STAS domain-containing protein n=1 Tax=Streptomyces sp. NPDC004667 TaxID=3154285 RepID=UPI0033B5BF37
MSITGAGTPGADMCLTGHLNAATAGLLAGVGADQTGLGQRELRVDVSGLCSCDAAGLNALVALRRRLHPAGVRVLLTGVSEELRRLAADRARFTGGSAGADPVALPGRLPA